MLDLRQKQKQEILVPVLLSARNLFLEDHSKDMLLLYV